MPCDSRKPRTFLCSATPPFLALTFNFQMHECLWLKTLLFLNLVLSTYLVPHGLFVKTDSQDTRLTLQKLFHVEMDNITDGRLRLRPKLLGLLPLLPTAEDSVPISNWRVRKVGGWSSRMQSVSRPSPCSLVSTVVCALVHFC